MVSSTRTVTFPGVVSPGMTLSPLRRGPGDPTFQVDDDGAIWRTSLLPSGSVTARISRTAANAVDCTAWGSGTEEFLDALPAMLGAHDDSSDFIPVNPIVAAAHERVPQLRLGRTDQVLEALIPAVLEQRVPGADAFRAWRVLVTKFGSPAPGRAPSRERLASWPAVKAREALISLPGVGIWTAAETAQRAFGDADALSVGDYNISKMVGWTLLGHPIDDDEVVELLEPLAPHRHRVVRLLEASRLAYEPRRGARLPVRDIRAL